MKISYNNVLEIKGDFNLLIDFLSKSAFKSQGKKFFLDYLVPFELSNSNNLSNDKSDASIRNLKNWKMKNWGCISIDEHVVRYISQNEIRIKLKIENGNIVPWIKKVALIYPDLLMNYTYEKKSKSILMGRGFILFHTNIISN